MLVQNWFDFNSIEKVPTRDGYGKAVVELGKQNPNVVVLTCDLSESTRSHWFAQTFPERFIEVGIAEQNMLGIAAGLALEGKIPFCSSYAVFNPGRNWDQLRVSVCYNNVNVKIIGAHAGISVGPDGATHQALEDIALTRVLPNLTVVVPCDYNQAYKAVSASIEIQGPVYIRLMRSKTPVFTLEDNDFEIGKADVLKQGKDVTIIACGQQVYDSLLVSRDLQNLGIDIEVINLHTIKPIDKETLLKSLQKTKAVVCVEEHQIYAGMGSAVAELVVQNYPVPIEFVGIQDTFGESGQPEELLKKYKVDRKSILDAVLRVFKRKNKVV